MLCETHEFLIQSLFCEVLLTQPVRKLEIIPIKKAGSSENSEPLLV